MRIDSQLNLVVPVDTDTGRLYMYSAPIAKVIFEQYFLVMSKAFAAIYAEGLNVIAGPRIAMLMLKKIAEDLGVWADQGEVIGLERGLIGEIRRTSTVFMPTSNGWQNVPLQDAITHEYLAADDIEEAEGLILFFILVSAIHKKDSRAVILMAFCEMWGVSVTSLSVTAYRDSLPISNTAETTGANSQTKTSLVPS